MNPATKHLRTVALILVPLSTALAEAQESLEISAGGLGLVSACDPLERVDSLFPDARDTTLVGEDGETMWPAKFVPVAPHEWLFFESSWADTSTVSRWSTNSVAYKTPRGYSVGMTVQALRQRAESIRLHFPEGHLVAEIIAEDVAFVIDSAATRRFFDAPDYWERGADDLPSDARIEQLISSAPCWER